MPGALLAQTTSFIGREAEIAELRRLLEEDHRLLTVLGPPGVGKTRLALHFARSESSGAWLCDVTEATDVDGVCAALAETLGVSASEGEDEDVVAHLGAALASRGDALIVLDNFEQLVPVAAETIGAWIQAAPEARFMVTSRERLRLPGEVVLDLEPLGVPDADRADAGAEAVQLFIDRARAVRSGWEVSDEDLLAISRLVRELDGLPLAIELAAARARVLGPAQLLAKLTERLELLRDQGGSGRWPALRAALDWSWDLLGPWERAALAQCAVFRGGFGIDAAEAVLDLTDHDGPPPVLDAMQSLCDRSLVRTRELRDLPGELRFALYASVREYANEQLDDQTRTAAERRHADYYLGWAEGKIGASPSPADYARLAAEHENLSAVLERGISSAADTAGVESALRAALALEPLSSTRGPQRQRLGLLDAALAAAGEDPIDDTLAARALVARAAARHRLGMADDSRADLILARERAGDAPALLAAIDTQRGTVDYETGERAEAREAFERACERAEAIGDHGLLGRALAGLGKSWRSQPDRARELLERAQRELERANDQRRAADVIAQLGEVDSRAGDLRSARSRYERALTVYREIRDARGQGIALVNLAALDQEEGLLDRASRNYDAGVQLLGANGDVLARALHQLYQGTCYHERGLLEDARECYEDALEVFRRVRSDLHQSQALGHLAVIDATEGRIEEAAHKLDEATPKVAQANTATSMAAISLQRGHLDLARGRAAAEAGDLDQAREHWKSAAARLKVARHAQDNAGLVLTDRSQDLRGVIRLLGAAVGEAPPWEGRAQTEDGAGVPDDALVVATTGRWFRPPGGERVDIRRRGAIRRLLERLAELRGSEPGTALDREQLLEVGWPGEIVQPEAGARRVHTALWTLRKLGLRDVLLSRDDGYLLDPAVPIVRGDE
jgi:predicted ATPase